ncbi:MAG: hypothetical protein RIS64_3888 [Bacteroidota bacterium]
MVELEIFAVERLDLYEWGRKYRKYTHPNRNSGQRGPAKTQKSNEMEGKEVLGAKIQKKTVGFRKNTLTLS